MGGRVPPWKGVNSARPTGSLRSLPSTACDPIWGVCYIKCAFIIVVSGNL